LLLITLFMSFSGYLLPWDQLSFWAVTIGTSMAEAAPPQIVGTSVNLLLRGAPDIGAGGLLRFYLLHVFLGPLILAVFVGVHYYKVVLHGASLPPQLDEVGQDTAKRIPMDRRVYFTPDILTNELTWFGLTSFVLVVMCIWFYHAPLEHHANPGVTPLHTTAPWYFLWLQGMLKLGDKVFWGLVIPTVLLGAFFVWPYLDVAPSRRYAHRRFTLSLMLIFITVMLFLSYMGTPKYGVDTAGDQEIAQELAPVEGVGSVRLMAYDSWVNGTFCVNKNGPVANFPPNLVEWAAPAPAILILPDVTKPVSCQAVPADHPEMRDLMNEYIGLINRWGGKLPNLVGILNVVDNQVTNPDANGLKSDVKRIDIKLVWNVPDLDANNQLQYNPDGTVKLKMVTRVIDANGSTGQAPAIQDSGKPVFVDRLSEYHGE